MADKLVWVKFKSGKRREVSAHIAYDENHQKAHGFKPESEVTDGFVEEPQKKIVRKDEPVKSAVVKSEVTEKDIAETVSGIQDEFANLNTVSLDEATEQEETAQPEEAKEVAPKEKGKPGRKPKAK